MGKKIRILIGLVAASMIGPSGFAEGEELLHRADNSRLARRILLLQREYRLRNRAMALLSEVSLFDDDATRGRSVQVREVDQVFVEITGSRAYVADVRYETAGVGDRGGDSPALVTDLEALRLKIRALEEQLTLPRINPRDSRR